MDLEREEGAPISSKKIVFTTLTLAVILAAVVIFILFQNNTEPQSLDLTPVLERESSGDAMPLSTPTGSENLTQSPSASPTVSPTLTPSITPTPTETQGINDLQANPTNTPTPSQLNLTN